MFKTLKYLLFVTLYKKAKKSFTMLFIYIVVLILGSLILTDMMNIASGSSVYIFLLIKWSFVLVLMSLIVFSIFKILNVATNPFEKTKEKPNDKKSRIISKEELFTKSDLIIQKYMKDVS